MMGTKADCQSLYGARTFADAYSFHTFLLPLYYQGKQDALKTSAEVRTAFEALLRRNGAWKKINWEDEQLPAAGEFLEDAALRQEYATFQYFHPAARAAIFGAGQNKGIVSRYMFHPGFIEEQAKQRVKSVSYVVTCPNGNVYVLPVYSIQLRVYDLGIAVLILQAVNREYSAEADIKAINQFGRRIRLPFLPNDLKYGETAEKLQIFIEGDQNELCVDFQAQVLGMANKTGQAEFHVREETTPLLFVPDLILRLLDYGSKQPWAAYDFAKMHTAEFSVQPITDDRMFVVCAVCNPKILRPYSRKWRKDGRTQYAYQMDAEAAKRLYAVVFVDKEGATCQNDPMVQALLAEAVYARWIDWGTLHAVTHHSMFCLTGTYEDEAVREAVVTPFLTEYMEIAVLLLVQRASIIVLQKEASRISALKEENKNVLCWRSQSEALLHLQKAYVNFQNQLALFEVTPQEQGVEIYQLMRRQLYVAEELEQLEKQLHNLYELATVRQGINFSVGATCLAIAALLVTILGFAGWPSYLVERFFGCGILLVFSFLAYYKFKQ